MTQRATPDTLGFRPFPGGDSRTQCGEVVMVLNHKRQLHPTLLTSRNRDQYRFTTLQFPTVLPPAIDSIRFAERVST